ncbi:MAG TPA: glycosyltransferase family 4 protein [Acidimicrobiales bacterium]|nr:glycosyltransferase family 4 protein [Acidimicrobiales bacterium]
MRIALVHPYAWPEVRRGAERYVDDLARFLASAGHEITVVAGTHGRGNATLGRDGVATAQCPHVRLRGGHRLGIGEVETFGWPAFAWLRRSPVDLVHAMTPTGALAGRAARRPTLYTVLGHPTADQLPTSLVPRMVFRAAVRWSTDVAALSRASAGALVGSTGRTPLVLPPGIRADAFPPALGARSGPPRLLFSASLDDPRKHAGLAVDAFSLVLDRRADARLVLSGQGDPAPLLAAAATMGDHVRAAIDTPGAGTPDEVPGRYRHASVTVLPSEHEAFGLALVESLASGTPVVCGPHGGMPEIVTPDVGRVADRLDAPALAAALLSALELAADPATPARCAARASWWDWEQRVGPEHLRVYERLVSRAAWRRPVTAAAPS